MDNLKYFKVLLITLTVVFSSCEKQLEESVYSSIVVDNFYKTAEDAEAALTSVYTNFSNLYGSMGILFAPEMSADQIFPRPVVARNSLTIFSYDTDYSGLKSNGRLPESPVAYWQNYYQIIDKANWVIEKVPGIAMDEKRKKEIIAEALCIRGYAHFQLARAFGDVIIKTKPTINLQEAYLPKSPKTEVYKQILSDLEAAANDLPTYSPSIQKGRPSKEVALALYAKAALYAENWSNSLKKAEEVISSGKYSLMSNPVDVFDVEKEDLARTENMWAYEAERVGPAGAFQGTFFFGPPSQNYTYSATSNGALFAYLSFFKSFAPTDKRRQLLDTSYVRKPDNVIIPLRLITSVSKEGVLVGKYKDPGQLAQAQTNSNCPFIRYADVFLIAAEAEARLNGATSKAYQYINIIRRRAGLADLQAGLSKEDFIKAVLQERSWEFFAEGDRWFDLTRTNTFIEAVKKATNDVYPDRSGVQPKHRYWPIPQDEINANPNLEQNPDWK